MTHQRHPLPDIMVVTTHTTKHIPVLHPVKTYHFGDACVYFVKDAEDDGFIERMEALPIIFNDIVYDLTKMDERDFKDQVM